MTTILICIVILYLLPAYYAWRYIHIAHAKGGIYELIELGSSDMFIVICPFLNILACIVWWDTHPQTNVEHNRSKKIIYWFFKVKTN